MPTILISQKTAGLFGPTSNPKKGGKVGVQDDTRQEKTKKVLEKLESEVKKLQNSSEFRKWLNHLGQFHDYSFGNIMLIAIQRANATRVAGFNTWKKLGRNVKKGEKGIAILAPFTVKRKISEREAEEAQRRLDRRPGGNRFQLVPEEDEEGFTRITMFRVVHVFDISQTEGKDLPDFKVPLLKGDDARSLFNKLWAYAKKDRGLNTSIEQPKDGMVAGVRVGDNVMGFWLASQRLLWVRPGVSVNQQTKVLIHELGHEIQGHQHTSNSQGEKETEAEAVAYAVGQHYGFDTGDRSFGYIATWSRNGDDLRKALKNIQATVDKMIDEVGEFNMHPEPRQAAASPGRRRSQAAVDQRSLKEGRAAFRAGKGSAPAQNAKFTKRVVKLPHAEMLLAMDSYSKGWMSLQRAEADKELRKMGFPGSGGSNPSRNGTSGASCPGCGKTIRNPSLGVGSCSGCGARVTVRARCRQMLGQSLSGTWPI